MITEIVQLPTQKQNRIQTIKCFRAKLNNANTRGKDFDMSLHAFRNLKKQKYCAYSGKPLGDDYTLERIDNNIGYVDGNVIPVLGVLNQLRSDKTIEQLIKERDKSIQSSIDMAGLIKETEAKINSYQETVLNLEPTTEQCKPKVKRGQYKKFMKIMADIDQKTKQINDLNDKVEHFNQLIARNTSKVVAHRQIRDDALKNIKNYEEHKSNQIKRLNKMLNVKSSIKKLVHNPEITRIEDKILALMLQVDAYKVNYNLIEQNIVNYVHLIQGLKKFNNLTRKQKSALKLGLSIDTSLWTILKHNIAFKLLGEKL